MKKENNDVLSKILICLYVIIALLAVNTLVLIIKSGSVESNSKTTEPVEEENLDYDVSMFNEISIDDIDKVFKKDEIQVIYIGRATCGYCVKFLPILQKAQEEYKYTTQYLDISKITDAQPKELFKYDNDDEFLANNFGSTPMVLLAKNGKMIDTWVGYSEYDEFAKFLDKNM